MDSKKQILIFDEKNSSLIFNSLDINQRVYFSNDNYSFKKACKLGDYEVVKYLLESKYPYKLMKGFLVAIQNKKLEICKLIFDFKKLNLIEDDFIFFTTVVNIDSIEILDFLFKNITKQNKECAVKKTFNAAVYNHNLNILNHLLTLGYFFNEFGDDSVLYICLLKSKFSDLDYGSKVNMTNTYKWLEQQGAQIKEKQLDNLVGLINDVISLKLVLSTIQKLINISDLNFKIKYLNSLCSNMYEIMEKFDKKMIEEYLNNYISVQLFLDLYINRSDLDNLEVIFFLVNKGGHLDNSLFSKILYKLIEKNQLNKIKLIIGKFNIKLELFEIKYIDDLIKSAISYGNLETNQFLHSLINYNNFYPITRQNFDNYQINKFFTNFLTIFQPNSKNIFSGIFKNRDVYEIIPWLISLGYIINKKNYLENIIVACKNNNLNYVIYAIDNNFISEKMLLDLNNPLIENLLNFYLNKKK